MKNLKERIKLHEGYRNTVYKDTLGFRTIGYGHKVTHTDDFVEGKEYPKEQLDEIFDKDFEQAWNSMNNFCSNNNINDISITAKEILCEMIFQMGFAGVGKFRNMIKALQSKDYSTASKEMLDSAWNRQTPNRAKELSDIWCQLAKGLLDFTFNSSSSKSCTSFSLEIIAMFFSISKRLLVISLMSFFNPSIFGI